jgi:hypothetical protein
LFIHVHLTHKPNNPAPKASNYHSLHHLQLPTPTKAGLQVAWTGPLQYDSYYVTVCRLINYNGVNRHSSSYGGNVWQA